MFLRSTKSFGKLNEKQNKAITVILNGITKLEVLIGDILDVYKLDIGKLKLKKIDVNVEKLVNQIVTEFKPLSKGHKVTFTVEDNGIGIPADKMDNLFKKFYQIDTTLTRKHGGTGLGLSICKGIIEAHNGTIWLDKGYSKGASFKFTLPRNGGTV